MKYKHRVDMKDFVIWGLIIWIFLCGVKVSIGSTTFKINSFVPNGTRTIRRSKSVLKRY